MARHTPAAPKRKRPAARRTAPGKSIAAPRGLKECGHPVGSACGCELLPIRDDEPLDPKLEITPSTAPSEPAEEVEAGKELSPRHRAFVAAYAKCWNGTKAYVEVYGASEEVARTNAARLLSNARIKAALHALTSRVAESAEITVDFVLQGAKEVLDRSLQRVPVMYFDHDAKAMKQETTMVQGEDGEWREEGIWKFDATGAMRALELMAKHTGGFVGKDDESGRGGVTNNFYFEYAGQRIYF